MAQEGPGGAGAADPLLGRIFEGRYRVDSRLGQGGMGTVYQAHQVVVNRAVALKVLHTDCAQDERDIARFRQEARAVATLRHPHTVSLIDYGETDDGVLFLVMELVRGRTLREVITEDSPMPVARATHIVAQIAESLAEAHASGIVHRDLKPSNVLLTEIVGRSDFVKVVDFGIAKVTGPAAAPIRLTGTGLAIGSPRFMSPEQVSAMPVSAQSDLYALGVLFHEMITGRPLFSPTEPTRYLIAHLNEAPPWPEVEGEPLRGAAVDLCMACLSKLPSDRPADALEVLERLQGAAAVQLLGRLSPARASEPSGFPLDMVTTSDMARGPSLLETARGALSAADTATTRPDRAAARSGSLHLPGQHLAVSSSPTRADYSAVQSGTDDRSELVTLVESGASRGARHQLQTGFPTATRSGPAALVGWDRGAPGHVHRRRWLFIGTLLVASAAIASLSMQALVEHEPLPVQLQLMEVSEPATGDLEPALSETQGGGRAVQETPANGTMLLKTHPEGARVLVDGEPVGIAPVRLSVPGSEQRLELELDGYQRSSVDIRGLKPGGQVIVRLRARD